MTVTEDKQGDLLDALLALVDESSGSIETDPEKAFERVLARHVGDWKQSEDDALEALEAFVLANSQKRPGARRRRLHFGHRVVGNLLLGLERVLTREDIDATWRRLEAFRD